MGPRTRRARGARLEADGFLPYCRRVVGREGSRIVPKQEVTQATTRSLPITNLAPSTHRQVNRVKWRRPRRCERWFRTRSLTYRRTRSRARPSLSSRSSTRRSGRIVADGERRTGLASLTSWAGRVRLPIFDVGVRGREGGTSAVDARRRVARCFGTRVAGAGTGRRLHEGAFDAYLRAKRDSDAQERRWHAPSTAS